MFQTGGRFICIGQCLTKWLTPVGCNPSVLLLVMYFVHLPGQMSLPPFPELPATIRRQNHTYNLAQCIYIAVRLCSVTSQNTINVSANRREILLKSKYCNPLLNEFLFIRDTN